MPKHCCCSCCFRARLITVTERHHSVVLQIWPEQKLQSQKYLGRHGLPWPLIKSAYGSQWPICFVSPFCGLCCILDSMMQTLRLSFGFCWPLCGFINCKYLFTYKGSIHKLLIWILSCRSFLSICGEMVATNLNRGSKKHEVQRMIFSGPGHRSLQCFDTVCWVTGRTSGLWIKVPLWQNPGYFQKQLWT